MSGKKRILKPGDKHYASDFLRKTVKDLAALHLPVIVRASYEPKLWDSHFVTFRDIRAYAPGISGNTVPICQHINLLQSDILSIYGEFWHVSFPLPNVYLVTESYPYFTESTIRYGLRLADVFDFPPVQISSCFLDRLPKETYVDFHVFGDGRFLQIRKEVSTWKRKKSRMIPPSRKNRAKGERLARRHRLHGQANMVLAMLKQLGTGEKLQ